MNDVNLGSEAVSVRQAGKILGGLSHTTVYRLINDGKLRSFRVGRRRLIGVDAIRDYIAEAEKDTRAAA